MIRSLLFFFAVLTPALAQLESRSPKPGTPPGTRPNIVFFLVDDLGIMDIGAYNPDTFYETPNCDRIAAAGCRFTSGYAANPVCSPTRYSIMTGRYPSRPDATNFFAGARAGLFKPAPLHDRMDLDEVTLAEALKEAGYATCFAGKWHLGPTEEFWPEKQGFDVNLGGHSRGSPPGGYFSPYNNPRLESGPKGEHLPERLADDSIKFIETHLKAKPSSPKSPITNNQSPFLLYLSFYSVHTPLQGKPELIEKYKQKAAKLPPVDKDPEFADEEQVWKKNVKVRNGKRIEQPVRSRKVRIRQRHPTYAAMMESMDTAVGRVLDTLDKHGITKNTIVVFMSDNGGLSTSEGSPTSNLPFRGGKGWLYEGGIREPYLIVAPGVAKPGSVCDHPVISTDFYPTLLDLAGLPAKSKQHTDGRSLVPLLKDPKDSLDRPYLFWHYPHYSNQGGFPGGAVRSGNMKLVERYEDGRVHLYDLSDDPGEKTDIAARHPDRVNVMRTALHKWYKEVDAKFLQGKDGAPKPWRPSPH